MRLPAIGLILLVVLFGWLGCRGPAPAGPPLPGASGPELYGYLTRDNPYQKWQMWPGKAAFYTGTEPHGMLLTTYVTDGVFSAVRDKKGSMPEGGIIVKENYMPDKTLAAVTVMYKAKGFDPANNDWFWLKYEPGGKITDQGKVQMCIDCHGERRGNDFIYTGALR
ncbi:MAG: cytochrome P460 family protein [Chloroflexi bacterium]|nr:cytochrome P460 family protein [Chloroflexota bacterium]